MLASVEGREPLAERLEFIQANGVELLRRSHLRPSLSWRLIAKIKQKEPDEFRVERFQKWISTTRPDLICISHGGVVDDVRFLESAFHANAKVVNISQANAEEWWPNDLTGQRSSSALQRCHACFFVSEGNLRLWETQTAQRLPNASVVRNPFNVSYQAHPAWPDSGEVFFLPCV